MKNVTIHSMIFYTGSKFQLMPQIKQELPTTINRVIEPFTGGGAFFLNVDAKKYLLNDFDPYVVDLHQMIESYKGHEEELHREIYSIIGHYGLSLSYENNVVPKELKAMYPKQYYSHFNKEGYKKLKHDFNVSGCTNMPMLYVLMVYGFNRIIRFNGKGCFNTPVGNMDFNANVQHAFDEHFHALRNKDVSWSNLDFGDFLDSISYQQGDLVYCDPPYLITNAEYNKTWDENTEVRLLNTLDNLNAQGVQFAISNVTHYNDKVNSLFLDWSQKYNSHNIESRYKSFNNNGKKFQKEVLITNY